MAARPDGLAFVAVATVVSVLEPSSRVRAPNKTPEPDGFSPAEPVDYLGFIDSQVSNVRRHGLCMFAVV